MPRLTAAIALCAAVGAQTRGESKAEPAADPVVPLLQAHAHNDYAHDPALASALSYGCMSVEADIHLKDDALLVAHDLEDCTPERTLEALYLLPLSRRVKENKGRVYAGGPREFQLLIDFKSSGAPTYAALKPLLSRYSWMLTRFSKTSRRPGAVTVVLSGAAPAKAVLAERVRLCAIDGWFNDVEAGRTAHQVPLLSASWLTHFRWLGHGPFSEDERRKLEQMVKRAHRAGRKIRFWAVPNRRRIWDAQLDAGVDWLNIDNLPAAQEFLLGRKSAEERGR